MTGIVLPPAKELVKGVVGTNAQKYVVELAKTHAMVCVRVLARIAVVLLPHVLLFAKLHAKNPAGVVVPIRVLVAFDT